MIGPCTYSIAVRGVGDGVGTFFILNAVAYDIARRAEYATYRCGRRHEVIRFNCPATTRRNRGVIAMNGEGTLPCFSHLGMYRAGSTIGS